MVISAVLLASKGSKIEILLVRMPFSAIMMVISNGLDFERSYEMCRESTGEHEDQNINVYMRRGKSPHKHKQAAVNHHKDRLTTALRLVVLISPQTESLTSFSQFK